MQTFPKDMETEKAKLMLTLLLAKKVADHSPSLLQGVFRTTVNFINQSLLTYVRNLFRNVRTSHQLLAISLSPLGLCPLPTHCLQGLGSQQGPLPRGPSHPFPLLLTPQPQEGTCRPSWVGAKACFCFHEQVVGGGSEHLMSFGTLSALFL